MMYISMLQRRRLLQLLTIFLLASDTTNYVTASTTVAGAKAATTKLSTTDEEKAAIQKYEFEQWFLLQSRSNILREELQARGITFPSATNTATTQKQTVDWDCALSTAEYPKSCLYSLDAQENSKVIAPIDTKNYISLSSLIRLRRDDPSKVEPMWHDRYDIFNTWFVSPSKSKRLGIPNTYSLYHHLDWKGTVLTLLLDNDWILSTTLALSIMLTLYMTRPILEFIVGQLLTSSWFWKNWPKWGRFVHAALPLKLLLGQMTYKAIARLFIQIKSIVHDILINYECLMWENSIPLTVIEESTKSKKKKKRKHS